MLDPHLTKPQGEELAAMQAATVPGMAFWAGSGPAGRTCRECVHWCSGKVARRHTKRSAAVKHSGVKAGSLLDQKCNKFARLSYDKEGDAFNNATPACKYFEENATPPEPLMVWKGKKGWQPIETPAAS